MPKEVERPTCQPTIPSLPTLFWRWLHLPYVAMRVPERGADTWIYSCDAAHNESSTAQYLARLVSHAHQSGRAPPSCQRVLFLLDTLSGPAETGAPLNHSNGALQPWGPIHMCLFSVRVTMWRGSSPVRAILGLLGSGPHLETCCSWRLEW